jgi:hypothetical protein
MYYFLQSFLNSFCFYQVYGILSPAKIDFATIIKGCGAIGASPFTFFAIAR